MRKPTAVLTALVFVLVVPAIAVAQSGVDQYEENVPGAGGNQGGNQGGNGGGGGDNSESSGGSSGSGSDGGSIGSSPGGEFVPGGSSGGSFGGSGGIGESGGSGSGGLGGGSGASGGSGNNAFGESTGAAVGIPGADSPTATLAQAMFAAAADDLTGAGATEADTASDSGSGGIGIWLPIILGASLLAAIGYFAFRRMRGSGGPATA